MIMIDSWITGEDGGCLVIVESPTRDRVIPLAAIAVRRELLGIDDVMECVEAICHIQDHGEPDPDPETGVNTWTEPFGLLRAREQAREEEAARARAEQCTEDVILERATTAAYHAVHVPVDDGDCAMDRCRRQARGKLGLPDPAVKAGVDTRSTRPPVPDRRPAQARAMRPDGGKAQLADLLADQADYLHACTRRFLHDLSGRDDDPLADQPTRATSAEFPQATLAKYGGGQ